jgi:thiol-disulfide isomerase/thioredoxin
MAERVALVLALVAMLTVAVFLVRRWRAQRIYALKQRAPNWSALGVQPDGRRTLIAFSTPSCAACHKAQAPAIDIARTQLGNEAVRVIRVDAATQPEAAEAFGILTVPSTVVVATGGTRIVAVNQGFAPSARLVDQLQHA